MKGSKQTSCPHCGKYVDVLFKNPMRVIDPKTGKETEDYMCRDCLQFTMEEVWRGLVD